MREEDFIDRLEDERDDAVAERDRLKAELAEAVELLERILRHGTYCGELGATDLADVTRDWLAKHRAEPCGTCDGRREVIPNSKSVNQMAAGASPEPCPDCTEGAGS